MSDSADAGRSPDGELHWQTDSLAASVVWLVVLTGGQRLIGLIRSVVCCRELDAAALGQWDLALGFLLTAAPLAVLGIPGSFGRYAERYRQRGQLGVFLRRTLIAVAALGLLAVATVWLARSSFSRLVLGSADDTQLVTLLAASLGAVVCYNTLVELFLSLRMVRVITALQLFNAVAFLLFCLALLFGWQAGAAAIVVAYGAACLTSTMIAFIWLRRVWRTLPTTAASLPHRDFWSQLLSFAAWIWLANALANLFAIVDRYMIVHYSGADHAAALETVGNYHASRIVPLLLVGLAEMLAPIITPHLSRDWEAGRRENVSRRLNLALKLLGLAMVVVSLVVLACAEPLFEVAFHGKFSGGLAVMHGTFMYCIWMGLAAVAVNYLWCAERARLASVALVFGLLINITLNLLLLPQFGLQGAVVAAAAANLATLVLILAFARLLGMRIDAGTCLVGALPLSLCLGPWLALSLVAAVLLVASRGRHLFDADDKQLLSDAWARSLAHWNRYRKGRTTWPA